MPPPLPLLFAQPEGEARLGSAGNAALAAAANAAAARAPSRRVHGVSPGDCSGSPGTAPSSARPPRSAPAPPPPRPAHRRRRPPQPSPAPARTRARAHAPPPSPHLPRRALPPPRPRSAGSRGPLGSLRPRPLPSCRVCRKQKAGGWPRSRAQGMRAGAAGPAHWGWRGAGSGERGGAGAWRGQPAWGRLRPGGVGARGCVSRGNNPAGRTGDACGPLSPSYSARPAPRPPQPLRDTCPSTPYTRPAGGAGAACWRGSQSIYPG